MNDFMAEVQRATELHDAAAVQRVSEKRLREAADDGSRRRRDDPDFADIVASAEKKAAPWMKIVAVIFLLISSGATWGVITNPLQTTAAAQEAHAAINKRIDDQDGRIGKVEQRLDNIDRNQTRSLTLQLRAEKRSLQAEIEAIAPGGRGRDLLQRQLDRVEQDIRDIEAE